MGSRRDVAQNDTKNPQKSTVCCDRALLFFITELQSNVGIIRYYSIAVGIEAELHRFLVVGGPGMYSYTESVTLFNVIRKPLDLGIRGVRRFRTEILAVIPRSYHIKDC